MLQTADPFVKVCTEFYYLYLTSTAEGWYDKKRPKEESPRDATTGHATEKFQTVYPSFETAYSHCTNI